MQKQRERFSVPFFFCRRGGRQTAPSSLPPWGKVACIRRMRGSHSTEWRVRRTERGCIDGRPCVLLPLPCLLKSARGAYTWHGVIGMQFLKIHTAGSDFIVCDAADLCTAAEPPHRHRRRRAADRRRCGGQPCTGAAVPAGRQRRPGQRHGGNDGGTGAARPRQMPLCHAH